MPGLLVAVSVTVFAGLAVEPALRVLSDEANLIGISKNLQASGSPTFTVSRKDYYGSYWDIDLVIDQRPTLFPFLVSLVHSVFGYSYDSAWLFASSNAWGPCQALCQPEAGRPHSLRPPRLAEASLPRSQLAQTGADHRRSHASPAHPAKGRKQRGPP